MLSILLIGLVCLVYLSFVGINAYLNRVQEAYIYEYKGYDVVVTYHKYSKLWKGVITLHGKHKRTFLVKTNDITETLMNEISMCN